MLLTAAQATLGLLLLFAGGEWLVRGASSLASRLGVSPLVIGLTVVAFGTSAPELVVSLDAAMSGVDDIAVGNVVGSNIANLALILALAAILSPTVVEAKVIRIDLPIMLAVSVSLLWFLLDGTASRLDGILLVAGFLAYIGFTFWEGRREDEPVKAVFSSAVPKGYARLFMSIGLVVVGLACLVAGGHLLVTAAVALATVLGVSEAVIGLTIVAIGTSLPEAATCVVAAAHGRGDIAVGNVVGSNIFNILGILGITALVSPLDRGALLWSDLGTMIVVALLVTLFILTHRRISRIEGGILIAVFIAYTTVLLTR